MASLPGGLDYDLRMVDTCKVMKEPLRCFGCGSRQYETISRIAQGGAVTCVECVSEINLERDNSAVFASALSFVKSVRETPKHLSLGFHRGSQI